MTAYGELGVDAVGKQGRRASLAGVLAGGVPLSPTSPSKAGSRNPPPPLSTLLVQLRTVSKMTAYGELGDDAMGKQGRRARFEGVLAGGVGFVSCVLLYASLLIFPSLLSARLARATLPHHSLPFWSNFVLSPK